MKKLLKFGACLIMGSLLILFFSYIAFIAWLEWRIKQPQTQVEYDFPYTRNTTALRYQIGSYRFNIPVNYNMNRQPGSAYTEIFKTSFSPSIRALWPDLKPYSDETHLEFQKLGWNNKFNISIEKTQWYEPKGKFDPSLSQQKKKENGAYLPEQMFYHEIYKRQQRGVKGTYQHDKKIPAEFIYYAYRKGVNEEQEKISYNLYAILEKGRYIYSAECDGSKAHPSPVCSAFFKYNDGIVVRYTFSLYLLKHWRQIESKIRNRVASFEQAAAEEKLKSIHNSH